MAQSRNRQLPSSRSRPSAPTAATKSGSTASRNARWVSRYARSPCARNQSRWVSTHHRVYAGMPLSHPPTTPSRNARSRTASRLCGTTGCGPNTADTTAAAGYRSPAQTVRPRLAPSHRCSCIPTSTVRTAASQTASRAGSPDRNATRRSARRRRSTARTPVSSTGASSGSTQANRNPVGSVRSSRPGAAVKVASSNAPWTASDHDSPRLTRTRPLPAGMAANDPNNSRPKSYTTPGGSGTVRAGGRSAVTQLSVTRRPPPG